MTSKLNKLNNETLLEALTVKLVVQLTDLSLDFVLYMAWEEPQTPRPALHSHWTSG